MDNSQNYIKSTLKNGLPYDLRQTSENPKLSISSFDKEIKPDVKPDSNLVNVYRPIPVNTISGSLGTKMWEIDNRISTYPNPKFVVSPWNNSNITLDKDLDEKSKSLL